MSNWQQRDRSDGGGQSWRNKDSSGGGGEFVTFNIPDRAVGRVIGRGGSRIRELQEQSGARIKVGQDSNHGEKEIEISGSKSACETARMLIEEIVNSDYSGGGGGGGGRGGGRGGGSYNSGW